MCDRAMTTADTILKNKNKADGCKSHRMKGRQKGRHRGVATFKALILWIQPLPGSSFILLTRGTRKSPLGFLLSVNLYLKTPWNKQEYTDSLLFFSPLFFCSMPFLADAIWLIFSNIWVQISEQTTHRRRICLDSHNFRGITPWSSVSIASTAMARENYLEGRAWGRKVVSITSRKKTGRAWGFRAAMLPQKQTSSNPGLSARPCFLHFYQFLFKCWLHQ